MGVFKVTKLSRIINISRRRAKEGHLSAPRQVVEMAILRLLLGIGPNYYHTAGFWRRELSWTDKTGQLSDKEYQRRVAILNPPPYRKLSQNKIPEKAILTLFNIPTAHFFGRLNSLVGSDTSGRSLRSAADLVRLVREQRTSRLVLKPLEGWGGKGIHIPEIEYGENVKFRESGNATALDADSYCRNELKLEKGSDWIVEEYFHQHPVMAALNPASVNTIRIWVLAPLESGECKALLAFARMGRGNMIVDNGSSGGIAAPVDLESGELGPARDYSPEYAIYPQHPDHGAPIKGVIVPYWREAKQLACTALSLFPKLRFAGMDVAIGPAGPVIQELNVCPDHDNAAIAGCPSSKVLRTD